MTVQALPPVEVGREIGRYASGRPGPLLIVTAGIHGNEPAGVHALRRVLSRLAETAPEIRGELVALSGNRAALARGARFVDLDLNRVWSDEGVARARAAAEGEPSESAEQRELLLAIDALLAIPRERVSLLDLHSTSAGSPPFTVMADTLRNRGVAFELGVPVLLGLEENVEGTLIEHMGSRGHVAVVLEGGQNQDPRTVDNLESAVWITLVSSGLLERGQVGDYDSHRARLRAAAEGLPHVIEVVHRHEIAPEDEAGFRMIPGLRSFQSIEKGRLLAHHGERADRQVVAPFRGVLLMPRYQSQGLDGFYLGRRLEPAWLRLSAALRRLRAERLVRLLPGVRMESGPDELAVDPRIARFFTTEILHLLGYRKQTRRERELLFARRGERP